MQYDNLHKVLFQPIAEWIFTILTWNHLLPGSRGPLSMNSMLLFSWAKEENPCITPSKESNELFERICAKQLIEKVKMPLTSTKVYVKRFSYRQIPWLTSLPSTLTAKKSMKMKFSVDKIYYNFSRGNSKITNM